VSLDGRRDWWMRGVLGLLLLALPAGAQSTGARSSTTPTQKPVAGKSAPARPGKPPAAAASTDSGRTPIATPENPVFVDCDKGRMEGSQQRFVCTGHVKMVRNTTTLTCDRSIGHYLGKDATQVTRLECFGNVVAIDGDRWAHGDHADYDTVKEVLVLTGNPEARQGTNTMKGDRVVFYVDTDLIEVERVKGVLESKGKEPVPGQKKSAAPGPPTKAP
jgi:lipopolysaccharide export system protein LptA